MSGAAGAAGATGSLMSATRDSVVRTVEATEEAFCQSGTGDPSSGSNDAFVDHVAVGIGQSIVAVTDGVLCLQVLNDDGALQTCVRSNLANRLLKSLQNDGSAGLLVAVNGINISLNSRNRIDECGAAACDDALFNSSLRCSQSVLNAHLLLFHFDLGSRTDLDNRYAACELCKALLQLLAVEIGRGGLDLASDLADTALDGPRCRLHHQQ